MRILYLSQLIPYPPDAGPKVRIYHVLQYLAKAGHEVTLVAFRRPGDEPEHLEHLRQICRELYTVPMHRSHVQNAWHLLRSLLTRQPFLISRDHVAAMHRTIQELAGRYQFDAIHSDQLWMAQYALTAQAASKIRPKLVLDQHNAVYLIPKRLAKNGNNLIQRRLLELEWPKLAQYEIDTCRQFDHVVWVTDEDRSALTQFANGSLRKRNNTTIPICVDPIARPVINRVSTPCRVTFLGGLHWPPNAEGVLWFVREIWPYVQVRVPHAVLTIIGKNPPGELKNNKSLTHKLEVLGYVDDPLPYIRETGVFIVPLHAGGGMRVKIVDAWSWGLPVVATTIGAEGLCYQDGHNLLLADDAETFAQSVVRILVEPDLARRLSVAGRRTVEEQYDWRKVYRAWNQVYPEE